MTELILHHYDMSPFGEKVRLMLGYKQLAWRSVHIPITLAFAVLALAHIIAVFLFWGWR